MRITDIQIERYGVWRDFTLPLAESGLSVFYGPNEAGKTTLLRFLRGVLFGFTPRELDGVRHDPDSIAGGLRVLDAGEPIFLRRGGGDHRGRVTCEGPRGPLPADETLSRLVGGIDDCVFEKVFAVGLREMQELGTLTDDSVAEHVYGLSLGPTGQRLLAAGDRVRDERRKLIDPDARGGELVRLFDQLDGIDSQLKSLHTLKRKHAELAGLRNELEDRIAGIKQRQAGIAAQLRGHTFLERAWGPWHRSRECDTELDDLPIVHDFPEHGLEKMRQIETDVASAAESRDRLIAQARDLRSQVPRLPIDRRLRRHGPALRSLIDQRSWLAEQQQRVAAAQRNADDAELTLESIVEQLGPAWTAPRLDSVDATPAASYRIASLARSLQAADSRRQQLQRLDERLTNSIRQRQAALRTLIESLPAMRSDAQPNGLAGDGRESADDAPGDAPSGGSRPSRAAHSARTSLDGAISAARQQLENLKQLAELRVHEAELVERQAGIDEHRERIAPQAMLPDWVTSLLWVFSLLGGVLAAWGLYIGQQAGTLAGAIYALLGITCGGVAWGLRTQFEGAALERLSALNGDSARNLADLRATRESIRQLGGQSSVTAATVSVASGIAPDSPTGTGKGAHPTSANPIPDQTNDDHWRPSKSIRDEHAWRPSAFWRWDARLRRFGSWLQSVVAAIDRGFDVVFDFMLDETAGALSRGTAMHPHPGPLPEADREESSDPARLGSAVAGEGTPTNPDAERAADLAAIREATQRLCELERWAIARRRLKRLGKRLVEVQRQLATAHREVGTARQNWLDLLGQLGLPAETRIETALDTWRKLADAAECRRRLHAARAEFDHHQRLLRSVVTRIEEQLRRMGGTAGLPSRAHGSPSAEARADKPPVAPAFVPEGVAIDRWLQQFDAWEQQLDADRRHRRTRRELRSTMRGLRRKAREYRELLDDLKIQRGALLVRGGAATTDEFEQLARWSARRTFLEDQAADARRDLEAISAEYPDLAVVESDLEAFDADRNAHAIEVCEQEAADLEHDLAETHERLGGVKHELSQLEQDARPAELRFEREQVLTQTRLAAGRWVAWETAAAAVEELRSRYERTCQPATLADASRFLARLTCGKYTNVWTPLGQRHLRVDDAAGGPGGCPPVPRSLPAESLSRGTREQLFLAVRLAVVQSLARSGVRLPMVLDDVIVNFDQRRAEAAVELLLEFAAQQHQVLFFTCHQHLADLFESRGATPIWLPAHTHPLPDSPPRRLAG